MYSLGLVANASLVKDWVFRALRNLYKNLTRRKLVTHPKRETMPTQVDTSSASSNSFQPCAKWTDDLPVCRLSGIGYAINQLYREDGCHQEKHSFEDRSFHVQVNSTYLYGVFDGQEGPQAASFALERMASEILLDQLNGKTTDAEVKEVLREAFVVVERSYFDSIDSKVAERTYLMEELACGCTNVKRWFEAYKKYPHFVELLKSLNTELACGTTAVIALIFAGRLFVANVGDSKALLCRTDSDGVLRVIELSADHTLKNEDELLRLLQLGLDVERLKKAQRLGNLNITRCLGNYSVKGFYREFEDLAPAISEPIIAEPEVHGGIPIDSSCQFLMLMSSGLYKSLEEAAPNGHVNQVLTRYVVKQFKEQSTLTGVAQAVVDNIVRRHHDYCMNSQRDVGPGLAGCPKGSREDITLLIRNFNYPLPNAVNSCTAASGAQPNPAIDTDVLESIESEGSCSYRSNDSASSTTETSSDSFKMMGLPVTTPTRIQPYVDFSEYHRQVEEARQAGTLPAGFDWW